MAKTDVLARVAADLARGHTQPAIQRLSSLVAAHPTDLDLRRRLAAVYRMVGNRIEAGRWSYLEPGADPAEADAFERAFPSPGRRLAALRWPQPVRGMAATEFARRRLDTLAEAASDRAGASAGTLPWPETAWLGAAAVAAALVVIGVITVVQWLL